MFHSRYSFLAILVLCFLSPHISAVQRCRTLDFEALTLPPEAGQLIYKPLSEDVLRSLNGGMIDVFPSSSSVSQSGHVISPDGKKIAWYELIADTSDFIGAIVRIHDTQEDVQHRIDILASETVIPNKLAWVNGEQILTFYIRRRVSEVYPFSILDIKTGQIEYVYPPILSELVDGLDYMSNPILTGNNEPYWQVFNFSPYGRYFIYETIGGSQIYDTWERRTLNLRNVRGTAWFSDARGLIYLATSQNEGNERVKAAYFYNITQDNSQLLYRLSLEEGFVNIQNDALSPDGKFLVIEHAPYEDNDRLYILDLSTGEVKATCFHAPGQIVADQLDYKWSRDGNYLAVSGALGDDSSTPKELYVYDVANDQIYNLYYDARIVGWIRHS